nr:MAG TPA: hypothetical protein [Caudoviricetes sp.]
MFTFYRLAPVPHQINDLKERFIDRPELKFFLNGINTEFYHFITTFIAIQNREKHNHYMTIIL